MSAPLAVACPKCGAAPGRSCLEGRHATLAHSERIAAAELPPTTCDGCGDWYAPDALRSHPGIEGIHEGGIFCAECYAQLVANGWADDVD